MNDPRLKFKVQFLQFRNNEKCLVKKLNISQSPGLVITSLFCWFHSALTVTLQ